MIGWMILVPNNVGLNNDRMELILVPNKSVGVDIGTKQCRIK